MIIKKGIVICAALVLVGAGLSSVAWAQEDTKLADPGSVKERAAAVKQDATTAAKERLAQAAEERRTAVKERLEGRKLKACQNREKAVTNIMARIGDRGQKQVDLFSKIAERTQVFYVDKGLSASNYDALVADVTAKKSAAQAAVDSTKSTVVEFKCDGDNPKGVADSFKLSKTDQNDALKAYKTSVKNLIVGVKSSKNQAGGEQ